MTTPSFIFDNLKIYRKTKLRLIDIKIKFLVTLFFDDSKSSL